ncbi:peptidyl-tRNA hydrolase [Petrocella atlantisensis]|uniref:Peptidyl-tRNA hydrolase n=1 Tax=Petrocella atlantisensis TaxID=2173034 RepID=A0A3P7PGS7_9FIRM|nr:aminoacyl-tRNA hydrolase [Petrocella atlantisensis]MCF8018554.1 aminoacyl-tRNA hydrolase [Vallitaleaceae bacterium]VDN48088.1 peptidyl-tRNA hydrolase [Petrocella atlantisensis]
MLFIIGLGNPGTKFNGTRHNIGFEVIERLAYDYHIKLDRKKHKAFVGQGVIKGEKVVLMKPQTYMNLSGEAIADVLGFYKETPDKIIIVYDDTSLDVGKLRIRERGSAGGHNGIKNIIAHMKTQEFIRIKVGVGEKPPGWDLADYVLSRFDELEIKTIQASIKMSADAVAMILDVGVEKAMNHYNSRKAGE